LTTTKNAGQLRNFDQTLAILIAMREWRYNTGVSSDGAYPELHSKPLDAAIG